MKIAYLISAYTDPAQLRRLIYALDAENVYFFIHLDKKSTFEDFFFDKANIIWLKKRRLVTWGGYSQVRVIFDMLKTAVEYTEHIDYFVSMTGTDYPIMSNDEIKYMFESNKDKQWICGYRTTKEKNLLVVTNDLLVDNFWGHIERRLRLIRNKFRKKKPYVFIGGKRAEIYQGSDYWALSRSCVCDMLQIYCKNKKLKKWMQTAFIPSELMMTTIFFNSAWKKQGTELVGSDIDFQEMTPLHYVVYRDKIKVMEKEDFNNIIGSGKMFFRKAGTGISDELIYEIDRQRNQ